MRERRCIQYFAHFSRDHSRCLGYIINNYISSWNHLACWVLLARTKYSPLLDRSCSCVPTAQFRTDVGMRRSGVWGLNAFFADKALLDEKNLAAMNLHNHEIKTLPLHRAHCDTITPNACCERRTIVESRCAMITEVRCPALLESTSSRAC